MAYMVLLVILGIGYYSFTYGLHIVKKEKNKLAAFGVFLLAFVSVVASIGVFFLKY